MKKFLKILGIGISLGLISVIGVIILGGIEFGLFKLLEPILKNDHLKEGMVLFILMSVFGGFIAYLEMD